MVFHVKLTRLVEIEIETAYEWLKKENPDYAERWFRDLMNKLATLKEQPRRCSLAIENDILPEEVRQFLYGKKQQTVCRILFAIRNDMVYVLHVRHGRQAPLTAEDLTEEE